MSLVRDMIHGDERSLAPVGITKLLPSYFKKAERHIRLHLGLLQMPSWRNTYADPCSRA